MATQRPNAADWPTPEVCPPFYSDDKLEVLSMHTARPVPPMEEMRRTVIGPNADRLPSGVERVVMKGLTKQPRERWPSSNRIAANTEPPSCTRAARFVGCGWGKWVIAEKDYDLWAMLQEDYDRPSPDGPSPSPSKIPRSPCTTVGCAY